MLSAGHDQVVNLVRLRHKWTDFRGSELLMSPQWTIPDLPEQHVDIPIVVHYPHFSTSDVHFGLIDW
jgi:polycomb protein EED